MTPLAPADLPEHTLLIAAPPDSIDTLAGALAAPGRTIRRATAWVEALQHLDEPPHLIVCGIHFENGRFYDLLKRVKEMPATRAVPFVAVRATTRLTNRLSSGALELAVISLGGTRYVDHTSAAQRGSRQAADESLRRAVDASLPPTRR
jgi:PleD family two-component response regulator